MGGGEGGRGGGWSDPSRTLSGDRPKGPSRPVTSRAWAAGLSLGQGPEPFQGPDCPSRAGLPGEASMSLQSAPPAPPHPPAAGLGFCLQDSQRTDVGRPEDSAQTAPASGGRGGAGDTPQPTALPPSWCQRLQPHLSAFQRGPGTPRGLCLPRGRRPRGRRASSAGGLRPLEGVWGAPSPGVTWRKRGSWGWGARRPLGALLRGRPVAMCPFCSQILEAQAPTGGGGGEGEWAGEK